MFDIVLCVCEMMQTRLELTFFSSVSLTSATVVSRQWSLATARRPRLWPCKCCCLCPNLTSTASTKWTVTMVTP